MYEEDDDVSYTEAMNHIATHSNDDDWEDFDYEALMSYTCTDEKNMVYELPYDTDFLNGNFDLPDPMNVVPFGWLNDTGDDDQASGFSYFRFTGDSTGDLATA